MALRDLAKNAAPTTVKLTLAEAILSAQDGKIGDIPYRRADTVVDKPVAEKMAEALREIERTPGPLVIGPEREIAHAALAAYEEATK